VIYSVFSAASPLEAATYGGISVVKKSPVACPSTPTAQRAGAWPNSPRAMSQGCSSFELPKTVGERFTLPTLDQLYIYGRKVSIGPQQIVSRARSTHYLLWSRPKRGSSRGVVEIGGILALWLRLLRQRRSVPDRHYAPVALSRIRVHALAIPPEVHRR
jgi:hypothetical protein